MVALNDRWSDELRGKYIEEFVDSSSDYYIENIKNTRFYSDGLCYLGYLWCCLKEPCVVPEHIARNFLQNQKHLYVMWDISTCKNIFIPDYWKYPKRSVMYIEQWTDALKEDLPEDIYLFDDTFRWSVIFTHETDLNNRPYCMLSVKFRDRRRYNTFIFDTSSNCTGSETFFRLRRHMSGKIRNRGCLE